MTPEMHLPRGIKSLIELPDSFHGKQCSLRVVHVWLGDDMCLDGRLDFDGFWVAGRCVGLVLADPGPVVDAIDENIRKDIIKRSKLRRCWLRTASGMLAHGRFGLIAAGRPGHS